MMLDELERLLKSATPGPWETREVPSGLDLWVNGILIGWVGSLGDGTNDARLITSAVNARLITSAVNALPVLLRVARAAERLHATEQEMKGCQSEQEYDELLAANDQAWIEFSALMKETTL